MEVHSLLVKLLGVEDLQQASYSDGLFSNSVIPILIYKMAEYSVIF